MNILKLEYSVYLSVDFRLFSILNIRFFILNFPYLSHCRENWRGYARLVEGDCMVGVDNFHPLIIKRGFVQGEFRKGGLGLLMGLRGGFRVCGYPPFQCTSTAVTFT